MNKPGATMAGVRTLGFKFDALQQPTGRQIIGLDDDPLEGVGEIQDHLFAFVRGNVKLELTRYDDQFTVTVWLLKGEWQMPHDHDNSAGYEQFEADNWLYDTKADAMAAFTGLMQANVYEGF